VLSWELRTYIQYLCPAKWNSPKEVVRDEQRFDGLGLGSLEDMLLAVEGLGGLALQHHVELLQGLDLASSFSVGHLGQHGGILENLWKYRFEY